jgi:hypothetical protein
MAKIMTNIGAFNVRDGLSEGATEAIINYINTARRPQIVFQHTLSVTPNGTEGNARTNIPTQWDLEVRIDLASPRAGSHGGIECPHAQINSAKKHGGTMKWKTATDRLPGGESKTRARVNYDIIGGLSKSKPDEVQVTKALSDVEVAQACRTERMPQGMLAWLEAFCTEKTR